MKQLQLATIMTRPAKINLCVCLVSRFCGECFTKVIAFWKELISRELGEPAAGQIRFFKNLIGLNCSHETIFRQPRLCIQWPPFIF